MDIYAQAAEIYKPILANAGLFASEDGFISIQGSDKLLPFVTEQKRWVLPLRERLADANVTNYHVFHPLAEPALAEAESPVLSRLRIAQLARINFQLCSLMNSLVMVASSSAYHASLTGDQRTLINLTPEATEKTMEVWKKLMEAMKGQVRENCFVSIFLKRHANIRGKTYTRGSIVKWPFYEALCSAEKKEKIFGVDVKEKERKTLRAIVEFMIPGIDDEAQGLYSHGSLHPDAPFLDAFLRSIGRIADSICALVKLFADYVPEHKLFEYSDAWREVLDNPEKYSKIARVIPLQASAENPLVAPVTQAGVMQQPVQAVINSTAAPAQLSVTEIMNQNRAYQAPPVYQDPRAYQGYPQFQPQPAPAFRQTGSVDDWTGIRRTVDQGPGYNNGGYGHPGNLSGY